MKEQDGISSPEPTIPIERFAKEKCLNEPRDSELERATINFIKVFKQFEENTRSSGKLRGKNLRSINT